MEIVPTQFILFIFFISPSSSYIQKMKESKTKQSFDEPGFKRNTLFVTFV